MASTYYCSTSNYWLRKFKINGNWKVKRILKGEVPDELGIIPDEVKRLADQFQDEEPTILTGPCPNGSRLSGSRPSDPSDPNGSRLSVH